MSELSDLLKALNSLPNGYISRKVIHGKPYAYFQYVENGKIKSVYVKAAELSIYEERIQRRKQIQQRIKEIQIGQRYVSLPSKEARSFTGYLMMEDDIVGEFENGMLLFLDEERAPLIVKRTRLLTPFLSLRIIDSSRTNARLLKRALGIQEEDDAKLSLYAYGASISDNYWFKAKHSKLKYRDICFDNDVYSDLSLKGEISIFPNKLSLTPELTTSGSFEKGWKKKEGHWYLYKNESKLQVFSELAAHRVCKLLGINTAEYDFSDGFIRSRNFAEMYNFSPIIEIAGEDDSYQHIYDVLTPLGDSFVKDYLKILYVDALLCNVDRHNENLGLMRDKKDGHLVCLAPNFDNNLCLVGYDHPLTLDPRKEGFMKLFVKFIKGNKEVLEFYRELDLPRLCRQPLEEALLSLPFVEEVDCQKILEFILVRSDYLYSIIHGNL